MSDPTDLSKHNTPHPFTRIPHELAHATVLGAGAWGTALASALQRSGVATTLWTRRADQAAQINVTHHTDALHGTALPPALRATQDLHAATRATPLIIFAVPASATRELARQLTGTLGSGTLVLSASKGFERETGAFMTQVLDEALGRDILSGVITGPSFAGEVARGEPTLLTLAMAALNPAHPRHGLARRQADALARVLAQVAIRVETTADVIGAQVGGALKNQIAIACGMAMGLGLGENARAGILTRGLDDMCRLTLALGGRADTLLGSCGVGDLFLTASSQQSRNTRLGMRLGAGECTSDMKPDALAEGAISAQTVAVLERALDIRLDLAATVRAVLAGVRTPAQALADLLEPKCPLRTLPRPHANPTAQIALRTRLRPAEPDTHSATPMPTPREQRHA